MQFGTIRNSEFFLQFLFSFWWNHTRRQKLQKSEVRSPSPETFRGARVRGGFSEASSRAKRGSTEAPPSEARPREGHREVAITKKLKKVPPESPGEPLILILTSFRDPGNYSKQWILLKEVRVETITETETENRKPTNRSLFQSK